MDTRKPTGERQPAVVPRLALTTTAKHVALMYPRGEAPRTGLVDSVDSLVEIAHLAAAGVAGALDDSGAARLFAARAVAVRDLLAHVVGDGLLTACRAAAGGADA